MLLDIKKSKESRIALVESNSEDDFQQLLRNYWTWHFDGSLKDVVRFLLRTELGWEKFPQLTTPPVGEVISPLGNALVHPDEDVRVAALEVLNLSISIPSGTALIGEACEALEIEAFDIGVYPVTNAQYLSFVHDTRHHAPKEWLENDELSYQVYGSKGDHPVVWISSEDAEVYAAYMGGRLPTFQEWQYASRGSDDRTFPWGDVIDKPRCNTAELGAEGTTPVGSFKDGISPFGCYDMLGNVWEWTSTPYDDDGQFRVACGGAWYYNHEYSTCLSYDFFSKEYVEFVIGFRIAF